MMATPGRPKLQHHLVEQVLCHSLPPKPNCLAYDSSQNLLAIGCDSGRILMYPHSTQRHENSNKTNMTPSALVKRALREYNHPREKKCVQLMSFNRKPTQGKKETEHDHQSYLLTSLTGHATVFLWAVHNDMSLELLQSYNLKEIPSVLEWSPVSSEKCHIGTEAGNVHTIEANKQTSFCEQIMPKLGLLYGYTNHGSVVSILRKTEQHLVVIYSSGVCVLWDKYEHELVKNVEFSGKTPLSAWFIASGKKSVALGCDDGKIYNLECTSSSLNIKDSHHVCYRSDESLTTQVQKIEHIRYQDNTQWLTYSESNTLYFQLRKLLVVNNLKPSENVHNMAGKVIDFKFLTQAIGAPELAVLTETELVLYARSTSSMLYPTVTQAHNYPFVISPVTYLQHCGSCGTTAQSEMIATGHADGSFRLWKFSYAKDKQIFSFEIDQVVYTTQYFTFSEEQLEKQSEAVTLIKMDHKHENLLIVNKCNHVLLFSYKKNQSRRDQVVAKPQSQEIILKDYEDKSSPAKILETPSPHFSPPSTNLPMQLLQHFSCHYHSKPGGKLEPVLVKCVEYNEEMGMLAVGTDRGLVVLDACKNMLIQVIGSDNKLIKICTEDPTIKLANSSSCDVTCLEIKNIDLNGKDSATQLTLWVGTASGVIACFIITRVGEEPLQLGGTGIYRKKLQGGSICGIHFHEVLSEAITQTNVLVSTREYITAIHCPFNNDETDVTKKMTSGIVKSGLFEFDGSPNKSPAHFVSLNKSGTRLFVQKLLDQGLDGEEQTVPISKTSAALFSSSGGSHCVIKCTDNRGPQLMYFHNIVQN